MKRRYFGKKSLQDVSGELLVADFHSALLNLVTMDVAEAEAKRSEANVTEALQYSSAVGNGPFLKPGDISPAVQESLVKHSVDAHLKKFQAAQISSFTTGQVSQLQAEDIKKYSGRKVRITRLSDPKDIFVSLWVDKQTGKLRQSKFTGNSVVGVIEELSFEQNALVLKPTLMSRTVLPARKYFLVYVINMETLMPAVKVQLF